MVRHYKRYGMTSITQVICSDKHYASFSQWHRMCFDCVANMENYVKLQVSTHDQMNLKGFIFLQHSLIFLNFCFSYNSHL